MVAGVAGRALLLAPFSSVRLTLVAVSVPSPSQKRSVLGGGGGGGGVSGGGEAPGEKDAPP